MKPRFLVTARSAATKATHGYVRRPEIHEPAGAAAPALHPEGDADPALAGLGRRADLPPHWHDGVWRHPGGGIRIVPGRGLEQGSSDGGRTRVLRRVSQWRVVGPCGGQWSRSRHRWRWLGRLLRGSPAACWQHFLAGTVPEAHLCFAAFAATRPAFRPGTLAAVSSLVGFGNIEGSGEDPLGRELRPVEATRSVR